MTLRKNRAPAPCRGIFVVLHLNDPVCRRRRILNYKMITKMKKEKYETPVAEALEVKIEGVICQSLAGAGVNDYGWNTIPEE